MVPRGCIRFIVYDHSGKLTVIEREVPAYSKRFDVCPYFDECPCADLDGVICTEENDMIRRCVCPQFIIFQC